MGRQPRRFTVIHNIYIRIEPTLNYCAFPVTLQGCFEARQ